MSSYIIPVSWEVFGEINIEAENLEEAIKIAEDDETIELPSDYHYVDGSWEVHTELAEYLNREISEE